MRKVQSWEDTFYGVKNTLLRVKNGVKVLHTKNPDSKEAAVHVVLLGGAYFEDQAEVPYGTAHFLEHLLNKPNKRFKTEQEMQKFLYGNRKKARVYRNAYTSPSYITFEATGHKSTVNRCLDFIYAQFDYPFERIDEFIGNLKEVIISERRQYPNESRDRGLCYSKFLNGHQYTEFSRSVLGEVDTILDVTSEDIKKYWKAIFSPENVVITIQSPRELRKGNKDRVEKIANLISRADNNLKITKYELSNEFKFDHFRDKDSQNITVVVGYYLEKFLETKYSDKMYKELALVRFIRNLMSHLVFMQLREEKGLLYSVTTSIDTLNWHWNFARLRIRCDFEKFQVVLEELFQLINAGMVQFLERAEGEGWLVSEISNYIFPLNVDYNTRYSENLGRSIVVGNLPYVYDFERARDIIKNISTKDVISYIDSNLLGVQPHIWTVSGLRGAKVKRAVGVWGG